ncbi:hypothetical protein H5410_055830 [Solanum commersonii]|uniref:Uncharacterized protein n=1 Tax=Solanum commersonii TaxID=4109 RepID=A0A9J5WKZ1_SOLCO|nr:hypothetical protein H5410_055830 [Solanum commersonii]
MEILTKRIRRGLGVGNTTIHTKPTDEMVWAYGEEDNWTTQVVTTPYGRSIRRSIKNYSQSSNQGQFNGLTEEEHSLIWQCDSKGNSQLILLTEILIPPTIRWVVGHGRWFGK